MREFEGVRALVMGLGNFGGGLGAVRFLVERGARVVVTDLRGSEELGGSAQAVRELGVEPVLGEHREGDFARAEIVVVNPAVPPGNRFVEVARASGARITSAIELLLGHVHGRIACVTGTQGKSSTCHILAQLLEETGRRVHLGGNFGGSLLESVDRIDKTDFVVLELSSYQLEALASPPPGRERVEVVGITNVLSDHLERHGSVQAYAAAKARILELLRDDGSAVVPAGTAAHRTGDSCRTLLRPNSSGSYRTDAAASSRGCASWTVVRYEPRAGGRKSVRHDPHAGSSELVRTESAFYLGDERLGDVADVRLPGVFQLDNVLTALGMARCLGVPAGELAGALGRVTGLEHRLQPLPPVAGRRVHDNGVSTTPDSTIAALRSLTPGVHLLCGGRRKKLPYRDLYRTAGELAGRVVCFGEAAEELAAGFQGAGVEAAAERDLDEATRIAVAGCPPGGELLFSPACTSFDGFPNFRARALAFRQALEDTSSPDPKLT